MILGCGHSGTTVGTAAYCNPPCVYRQVCWPLVVFPTLLIGVLWQNLAKPCSSSFYTYILESSLVETKVCQWMLTVVFVFADIGSERYTFSFTIRDSPSHFVNVNSWGREEYIRSLSESFRVGDCGKLEFILNTFLFECVFVFFPSKPVLCICGFAIFSSEEMESSLIGNKLFSYVQYEEEWNKISKF